MPKFSIGSWAFSFGPFASDPWSFDKVCRYASDAGYDGIEINGFRPHPHPDDYDSDAKCKELDAYLKDLGLGISGYAPSLNDAPPAKVEKAVYLKEIEKNLRFCNRMGIDTLRLDTITPPETLAPDAYEKQFQHLVSTWRASGELAAKSGVTIVWEFEPGFWLNKPSEVLRLVKAVDHPGFKLLFDTSHAYMGAVIAARHTGEPEKLAGGLDEYARMAAPYTGHVHFIDCDGTLHDNETSVHSPFGTGFVNFPSVLKALGSSLDPLKWWCFDFCFCPTTEVDGRKAIPFMKKAREEALA